MLNKAIIMGRLTRDPELRATGSGKSVTSFTVAVENGYGDNKKTDFINCVAWNKTAEFVNKYFTKGMMIIVDGRISTRSWDGQDGKTHYATEITASEVSFGETKAARERNAATPPSEAGRQTAAANGFDDVLDDVSDDLPF